MKQLRKPTLFIAALALFVTISCKNQEKKTEVAQVNYPENEIPVNTVSQEALVSFMDGMKQYEMGNYREARTYFDTALKEDSNFVSAQIYRAYTNSSAEDWSVQRTNLMAMRDKANEGEVLLISAIESGMEGDREKEGESYKALVAKYPKSAQAHDYLAGYYYNNDDVDKRRSLWKKAIELNPEYLPALMGLGMSYASSEPKDFKLSENYLQKAVEVTPDNSNAHISLGDGFRAQNKLEKALESYVKATQLNPEDDVAHMKAGHANNMLGNYEAARTNFMEAQKVSEFGVNGNAYFAYTYLYDGDHNKAMELLIQDVAEVDAMNIPASNKNVAKFSATLDAAQIAMHYNDVEKLQMLVEAVKPYSKQLTKDVASSAVTSNQNAFMLYWDGMAALAAKKYDMAEAKAESSKAALASINDDTKLRQYHFLKGMIQYKQGNFEKAKNHFEQTNKDYVYNKYWLAKAYEKLGDDASASSYFAEAKAEYFNSIGNALVKKELMSL